MNRPTPPGAILTALLAERENIPRQNMPNNEPVNMPDRDIATCYSNKKKIRNSSKIVKLQKPARWSIINRGQSISA